MIDRPYKYRIVEQTLGSGKKQFCPEYSYDDGERWISMTHGINNIGFAIKEDTFEKAMIHIDVMKERTNTFNIVEETIHEVE